MEVSYRLLLILNGKRKILSENQEMEQLFVDQMRLFLPKLLLFKKDFCFIKCSIISTLLLLIIVKFLEYILQIFYLNNWQWLILLSTFYLKIIPLWKCSYLHKYKNFLFIIWITVYITININLMIILFILGTTPKDHFFKFNIKYFQLVLMLKEMEFPSPLLHK